MEGLQYIGLVEKLGLADNKAARTIIGSKFNTIDLLMHFRFRCCYSNRVFNSEPKTTISPPIKKWHSPVRNV
ncbi:MAG: hypothetical protein IPI65_06365 [Bacteroidetes bacterium]|nr:hypothetical protein [Bacteroidota bacterium]